MTLKLRRAVLAISLMAMSAGPIATGTGMAADDPGRRMTRRVMPVYPVLAAEMKLTGTVELTSVVAAPVFIAAASDAAKQNLFQVASAESREMLTFVFAPQ